MLNVSEMDLFGQWKSEGIIKIVTKDELRSLFDGKVSTNYFCSDDRVDQCCYIRHEIGLSMPAITDSVRFYAGPADLASDFKEFNEIVAIFIRERIVRMIKSGLRNISVLNLVWHWPCGILKDDGHQMSELPMLAIQAETFLRRELPKEFPLNHFFHARKECKNCGAEEKNTYAFIPYG